MGWTEAEVAALAASCLLASLVALGVGPVAVSLLLSIVEEPRRRESLVLCSRLLVGMWYYNLQCMSHVNRNSACWSLKRGKKPHTGSCECRGFMAQNHINNSF